MPDKMPEHRACEGCRHEVAVEKSRLETRPRQKVTPARFVVKRASEERRCSLETHIAYPCSRLNFSEEFSQRHGKRHFGRAVFPGVLTDVDGFDAPARVIKFNDGRCDVQCRTI